MKYPPEVTRLMKIFFRPLVPGCLVMLALVLLVVSPASAATTVVIGTDTSKTVIKGTLVTPDQVIDGELAPIRK